MIRIIQCKCPIEDRRTPEQMVADYLHISADRIRQVIIRKRSIDARKKQEICYVYCLDAEVTGEKEILKRFGRKGVTAVTQPQIRPCVPGTEPLALRPVVVGAGPAGLFAACELAEHGYRPLVLERGFDVETRRRDVEAFWAGGPLKEESNVQFGEGGAGTFSDGKLNTMVKDPSGRIGRVLNRFVECGADPEILYDSKPHIGTDCLRLVVCRLRERILEAGGEVRFGTRVTDFELRDGCLTGLICEERDSCGDIVTRRIDCTVCILAIGHSSRDTFERLLQRRIPMVPKAFAVGFRMEHPQSTIQESQYGAKGGLLPPASYKVTAQTLCGRGVYSFCMCPGGMVVNASSESGFLAVNGMSNHARDGRNANSAIVVTVQPADFAHWNKASQTGKARGGGLASDTENILGGMAFQRQIERLAYEQAGGKIPVQLFGDYVCRRPSTGFGDVTPDMKGAFQLGQVREILPVQLGDAIEEGIRSFGTHIRGFDREDALLSGVESRTSSPVRILRDTDSLESAVRGLYPCGEGAGYAGGITSAAMDGIRVAEAILVRFARPQ